MIKILSRPVIFIVCRLPRVLQLRVMYKVFKLTCWIVNSALQATRNQENKQGFDKWMAHKAKTIDLYRKYKISMYQKEMS